MKKILVGILTALYATATAAPLYALDKGKGDGLQAYQRADDERGFSRRVSAWWAGLGKSKEEKNRLKAQRRVQRKRKKAEDAVKNEKKS